MTQKTWLRICLPKGYSLPRIFHKHAKFKKIKSMKSWVLNVLAIFLKEKVLKALNFREASWKVQSNYWKRKKFNWLRNKLSKFTTLRKLGAQSLKTSASIEAVVVRSCWTTLRTLFISSKMMARNLFQSFHCSAMRQTWATCSSTKKISTYSIKICTHPEKLQL